MIPEQDKPKQDDGGQAFPKTGSYHLDGSAQHDSYDEMGMSLRDYFAAHAMLGVITGKHTILQGDKSFHSGSDDYISAVARGSYAMANAMVEARKS